MLKRCLIPEKKEKMDRSEDHCPARVPAMAEEIILNDNNTEPSIYGEEMKSNGAKEQYVREHEFCSR
ncbi:hypothetical protein COOONC_27684 [Cooperia oncophora]